MHESERDFNVTSPRPVLTPPGADSSRHTPQPIPWALINLNLAALLDRYNQGCDLFFHADQFHNLPFRKFYGWEALQ